MAPIHAIPTFGPIEPAPFVDGLIISSDAVKFSEDIPQERTAASLSSSDEKDVASRCGSVAPNPTQIGVRRIYCADGGQVTGKAVRVLVLQEFGEDIPAVIGHCDVAQEIE